MLENRVFVITGATGGLGQHAARAYAKQGASLALLSTNPEKLDAFAKELNLPADRILTHAADLLVPDAVRDSAKAVTTKFGRVDALIHLVGGWTGGKTLTESSAEDLKFMLDQHAWSSFHLAQAYLPALQKNGWGRIVAVTSPLATQPTAKMGPYAIGKAAQETLLMTLADELRGTALTANVIQVQAIDVKGTGKGTSPKEIVAALLYLCSNEGGRVNGARIPIY
jgi:NAD(P)-dependent dehydrogenase (short-subunit alcohol dehydrogenase family)